MLYIPVYLGVVFGVALYCRLKNGGSGLGGHGLGYVEQNSD